MIYKRGKRYWYRFMWDGELIRRSTRQGNDKIARQMESAHRTALATGELGIRTKKSVPTLAEFCETRVIPWAKASFQKTTMNNWYWYRTGIRALTAYKKLASAKLDDIGKELAAEFASHRISQEKQVSTVNGSLRVLRRVLRLAAEWGVIKAAPHISLLPGENHRERVIVPDEEKLYLEHASELLKPVAIVLIDTGLRPDECYQIAWEDLYWDRGPHGRIFVRRGKTRAARRVIPMTPRVRFVLETRWEVAGKPSDGWVWPAPTKSGHINQSSLKKQHARAFRLANEEIKKKAQESKTKPSLLKPWVLYSFRHTFLTRLGESGCDVWTLARIAGHSSIEVSMRYVHPSGNAVLNAMSCMGGHNFGHREKMKEIAEAAEQPETTETEEVIWRARRDSNSRPNAPEAFALSS